MPPSAPRRRRSSPASPGVPRCSPGWASSPARASCCRCRRRSRAPSAGGSIPPSSRPPPSPSSSPRWRRPRPPRTAPAAPIPRAPCAALEPGAAPSTERSSPCPRPTLPSAPSAPSAAAPPGAPLSCSCSPSAAASPARWAGSPTARWCARCPIARTTAWWRCSPSSGKGASRATPARPRTTSTGSAGAGCCAR